MKKNNLCLVSCEAFGRAARCQEGFAERSEAGGVDAGEAPDAPRRLAWAFMAEG